MIRQGDRMKTKTRALFATLAAIFAVVSVSLLFSAFSPASAGDHSTPKPTTSCDVYDETCTPTPTPTETTPTPTPTETTPTPTPTETTPTPTPTETTATPTPTPTTESPTPSPTPTTATPKPTPTYTPPDDLPKTGPASLGQTVGAGAAAILAGIFLMLAMRDPVRSH